MTITNQVNVTRNGMDMASMVTVDMHVVRSKEVSKVEFPDLPGRFLKERRIDITLIYTWIIKP